MEILPFSVTIDEIVSSADIAEKGMSNNSPTRKRGTSVAKRRSLACASG